MAFGAIQAVSDVMELVIKDFVHAADIFVAGISMIVVPAVISWFIYRCYKIMSGQVPDPMLPLIQDFVLKMVILTFAGATSGSAALYQDSVVNTLRETPIEMAKEITKEKDMFAFFDKKFDEIEQLNIDTSKNNSHWWQINDKVDGVIEFAKIFVIYCGFIILALVATVIFIIEKTFFTVALGFGIIFIAFAAFNYTRQWFNSWLSSTLGYGLSYVVIIFVLATLFKNIDAVFALPEKGEITWGRSFGFFFICIFFAVIISRIGDVVSAWFGAGNIADGTALTALATGRTIGQSGLKGAAYGALGVTKVGRLGGKGISKLYNHFTKPSIKPNRNNTAIKQGHGGHSKGSAGFSSNQNMKGSSGFSRSSNTGSGSGNPNAPKTPNNPQGYQGVTTGSGNAKPNTPNTAANKTMQGKTTVSGASSVGKQVGVENQALNQRQKNTASHPPKYDKATRSFKR